ncbi:MAG: hypothetical protein IJ910_07995 [Bacteroidaceae bacterium]|nr:hypothetical protein [Bacteroidaceae bacterium]
MNPLMRLAYAELKVQTILNGAAPSLAQTDGGMDGKKVHRIQRKRAIAKCENGAIDK